MDCKIKKIALLAVLLISAACTQRYELNLPLVLNREEMRFKSAGDSYYVMVYCRGDWSAHFEKNAPWLELSRENGSGNQQIMVTASPNEGVSRGVYLIIEGDGIYREMYVSQESGLKDGGIYSLAKQNQVVMKTAGQSRILAGTNLDDETLGGYQLQLQYEEGEGWIHDINVGRDAVTFSYDANESGASRTARILLAFPMARWDTPVSASFTITQSNAEPANISADVTPIDGKTIAWASGDRIAIIPSEGTGIIPADYVEGSSFIYSKDELEGSIAGAVYPDDFVSGFVGGIASVTLPAEQAPISSPSLAAHLGLMSAPATSGALAFESACSLLKVEIQGSGKLLDFTIDADSPIAGEGKISFKASRPVYVPGESATNRISLLIPEGGLDLPASFYLAVASGELGKIMVGATTSSWSGSISTKAEISASQHTVAQMEEISLSVPTDAEMLTAGGKYANCFLIDGKTERMYGIDIRRPDGSVPADGITRCSVLWQTAPGVISYLGISPETGRLYFRKSEDISGNAHVAVQDAEGKVCWSYHIWAPAEAVQERSFGSFTMMDRNLGASEAIAKAPSSASVGMHYQWGRKDPFPPVEDLNVASSANHGKVYPDPIKMATAQDGVAPEDADANPTTHYWGSAASGKEDWLLVQDDNRWSAGSNANPCPYGWTVAPKEAYETMVDRIKAADFVSKQGITIADDNGAQVLFPIGGWYRRTLHATTEMASTAEGCMWTSTPVAYKDEFRGSYRFHIHSKVGNRGLESDYCQRRWGGTVRCVKIQ